MHLETWLQLFKARMVFSSGSNATEPMDTTLHSSNDWGLYRPAKLPRKLSLFSNYWNEPKKLTLKY